MRVISFTVFGNDPLYQAGAVANARLCSELYPGWACRFHLGRSVAWQTREKLAGLDNVEIVDMSSHAEDWSALFWRYLSVRDPAVTVHAFRDADSRPCQREAVAVGEWLTSGRDFHIMRDHEQHWIEILGGMWGCTAAGARQIQGLLPEPLWNSQPYVDQWWLKERVYPVARRSMFVHDSVGHVPGEQIHPFPATDEPPGRFVGQSFNADGTLRVPSDAVAIAPR